MAAESTYSLRLRGVTKRYGEHVAVSELSFEVARGVIYGVLGPSGAGKSTTLRMVAGHESFSDGEVRIGGDVVNELPPARRPTDSSSGRSITSSG